MAAAHPVVKADNRRRARSMRKTHVFVEGLLRVIDDIEAGKKVSVKRAESSIASYEQARRWHNTAEDAMIAAVREAVGA